VAADAKTNKSLPPRKGFVTLPGLGKHQKPETVEIFYKFKGDYLSRCLDAAATEFKHQIFNSFLSAAQTGLNSA
jgi:hypothetical protein